MSYCDLANALPDNTDNPNKHYHDHEYGFPVSDDRILFERLVLEINQAGLSWTLMLKNAPRFKRPIAVSTSPPLPPSTTPTAPACSPTQASSATA